MEREEVIGRLEDAAGCEGTLCAPRLAGSAWCAGGCDECTDAAADVLREAARMLREGSPADG